MESTPVAPSVPGRTRLPDTDERPTPSSRLSWPGRRALDDAETGRGGRRPDCRGSRSRSRTTGYLPVRRFHSTLTVDTVCSCGPNRLGTASPTAPTQSPHLGGEPYDPQRVLSSRVGHGAVGVGLWLRFRCRCTGGPRRLGARPRGAFTTDLHCECRRSTRDGCARPRRFSRLFVAEKWDSCHSREAFVTGNCQ